MSVRTEEPAEKPYSGIFSGIGAIGFRMGNQTAKEQIVTMALAWLLRPRYVSWKADKQKEILLPPSVDISNSKSSWQRNYQLVKHHGVTCLAIPCRKPTLLQNMITFDDTFASFAAFRALNCQTKYYFDQTFCPTWTNIENLPLIIPFEMNTKKQQLDNFYAKYWKVAK